MEWQNAATMEPASYTCAYCSNLVGPNLGYQVPGTMDRIYICSYCTKPTYIDRQTGKQYPGAPYGQEVEGIPDTETESLYREARDCMSVGAFTSAVLTARKILMHVAVAEGAPVNKSYVFYVEFLADKNIIPVNAKGWVTYIKDKGNEANHQIVLMSKEEAEGLVDFTAMLLKNVYEFPSRVPASEGAVDEAASQPNADG